MEQLTPEAIDKNGVLVGDQTTQKFVELANHVEK